MEHKSDGAMIPFAAYQMSEIRWHRRFIAVLLLIAFIVAAFVAAYIINDNKWRELFSEYDIESSDFVVDGHEGNANFIGNDWDIINGKDFSTQENDAL